MSPEDNSSWNEHRLMILDWHQQDILEKQEIRRALQAQERHVNEKLEAIQTTLTELGARHRLKITTLNLVVPAAVALIVLAGNAIVHALIK